MPRPAIGITVDVTITAGRARYEVATAYCRAVTDAGGMPLLLPHEPNLAADYAGQCDGLILTGGGDPAMEAFGETTDHRARVIDPDRQAFELALLQAASDMPHKPVLGVCLGMQLMALRAGAGLHQYLPDTLATAADHEADREHPINLRVKTSAMLDADAIDGHTIISSHRQAVAANEDQPDYAGSMRVIAVAPDGVVEAVDDPGRAFYVGVQWHPERGDDGPLNRGLFHRLVQACRF